MSFKYSITTNAFEELDIPKIARMCADSGLDGIEWGLPELDEAPNAIVEMNKVTRDLGLEVVGYLNAGHLWKTDLIKRYSEIVASVHGKMLRVSQPWLGYNFEEALHQKNTYSEMFKLCRDGLENLIPLGREYNIRYMIEMHLGSLCSSAEAVKLLLDGLDPKYFGIIYDPANGILDGFTRPRHALEVLGPYLGYVHAKNIIKYFAGKFIDGPVRRTEWAWAICGLDAGMVNWLEVCFGLKTVDFNGWISFEEFFKDCPEKEIVKAIAFMKECEKHTPSKPQPPFLTFND